MKFNRNLAIFLILLTVSCLMLMSQVSAASDSDNEATLDLSGVAADDYSATIGVEDSDYKSSDTEPLTSTVNENPKGNVHINGHNSSDSVPLTADEGKTSVHISDYTSTSSIVMTEGDSKTYTATVEDINYDNVLDGVRVKLTAGANVVTATTNGNGEAIFDLSGITAGNYTATVVVDDLNYMSSESLSFDLTVNGDSSKTNTSVTAEDITLTIGENATINAITTPEGLTIEYIVDNSGVVTVENGVVTAVKAGTAEITLKVGGDDDYAENSTTITVTVNRIDTSIDVVNKSLEIYVDDEGHIVTALNPDGGDVNFTSSDDSIITVDNFGDFKAVAEGTATITVSFAGDDKYNAAENVTISVKVSKIDTSIDFYMDPIILKVHNETIVIATLKPGKAGNVTYTSSNTSVVTVDKEGNVKAVGAGEANITASFEGNNKYNEAESVSVPVKVSKIDTKITVDVESLDLEIGNETTVKGTLTPAEAGNVKYMSNDTSIVTVDENTGKVTAVGEGDANIIIYYDGDADYNMANDTTVTVKVSKIETSIAVNDKVDMKNGDIVNVNATLTPADAGNLTYVSSNESVIVVSEDGLIFAFSVGSANVTVSFAGNDKYAACENKTISVNVSLKDASVSVVNSNLDLKVGDTFDLNATAVPHYLNVQYVSGNESVVYVTDYGIVTAVGEGTTNITLTVGNNITFAINSTTVTVKVSKIPTIFADVVVEGNNVSLILKDAYGNAIPNANISYTINGVSNTTVSDANGSFMIVGEPGALIDVDYTGSDVYVPSNISVKLAPLVVRQSTVILGNNFTQYAVDYSAGERGQNFTVQLKDANGNVLANKTVLIGYNGKTLYRTTDANGYASVQINLKDKNRLTFAVTFLGDDEYDATMSVYLITIEQKPVTITAAAKTYKATAKTKKYTVTLKTIKGSSADGKTYFAAGKKVTMKINGKTFTAKTNAKGQATFSLKITKKGKFTATVKYAGDNTYKSASKNVKITIK